MSRFKLFIALSTALVLSACGEGSTTIKCPDHLSLDAQDLASIKKSEGCMADVTGLVYQVYTSKSGKLTSLNFGSDYKADFSAVIFTKAKEKFVAGVIDGYANKKVKVHGVIKVYKPHAYSLDGAPQIVVNDPKQINVVDEGVVAGS